MNSILKYFTALMGLMIMQGCTSWGYKTSFGDDYPPRDPKSVHVLRQFPKEPYKEIGAVSAIGGLFTGYPELVTKLRKAAADLGADAVVLGDSGTSFESSTTNTSGNIRRTGDSINYNETSTRNSSAKSSGAYPTYEAIAIRYLKNDRK